MGLYVYTKDTGHELWGAPYSTFHRWRKLVLKVAGYDVFDTRPSAEPPITTFDWHSVTKENLRGEWQSEPEDPLIVLIVHSNCEGHIHPNHAGPLADRLGELKPLIAAEPSGEYDDDWLGTTEEFIAGLRQAAARNELVIFA